MQQISKILTLINCLQDKIRHYKVKFPALTGNCATTTVLCNMLAGEDINKIYERNKRSRNIVIYGGLESGMYFKAGTI